MAKQQPETSRAPMRRPSRPARLPLTLPQLQAYLIAREALRRLKGPSRPLLAREPSPPPASPASPEHPPRR
jgi:hypothetical protein